MSVTLSMDNLQYLCLECHNRMHGIAAKHEDTRHVLFNSEGEVVGVQDYRHEDS